MSDQSPTEMNYNLIDEKDFNRCRRMLVHIEKNDARVTERLVHSALKYNYQLEKPGAMLNFLLSQTAENGADFPELSDKEMWTIRSSNVIIPLHRLIMEKLVFNDDSCDFLNSLPQFVFCDPMPFISQLIIFAVFHKRYKEAEIIMKRTEQYPYINSSISIIPVSFELFCSWIKTDLYEAADAAVRTFGLESIFQNCRVFQSSDPYCPPDILKKICRRYLNISEYNNDNEALCELMKRTNYPEMFFYSVFESFDEPDIKIIKKFLLFLKAIGYKTNNISFAVFAAAISEKMLGRTKADILLKDHVFPLADIEPYINAEAAIILDKYRGRFFSEAFPTAVIRLYCLPYFSYDLFLKLKDTSLQNGIKDFPVIIESPENISSSAFIDRLEYYIKEAWGEKERSVFCEDYLDTLIENSNITKEEFNSLRSGKEL